MTLNKGLTQSLFSRKITGSYSIALQAIYDITTTIYNKVHRTKMSTRRYIISLLTLETRVQKRFTISEVTADWHELMTLQRTMRPSIARVNEQLDPQSIQHTNHRPNQLH